MNLLFALLFQTLVVGVPTVAWEQPAPSLAEAQAYTYQMWIGPNTDDPVLTAKCTGTASPFTCQATLPPLAPGDYNMVLTASRNGVSSEGSNVLNISVVTISPPINLRIVINP